MRTVFCEKFQVQADIHKTFCYIDTADTYKENLVYALVNVEVMKEIFYFMYDTDYCVIIVYVECNEMTTIYFNSPVTYYTVSSFFVHVNWSMFKKS